jgi:hypothetical protein
LEDDEATHAPTAERDRGGQRFGSIGDLRRVVGVRGGCDVEAFMEIDRPDVDAGKAFRPLVEDPRAASAAVDEQ